MWSVRVRRAVGSALVWLILGLVGVMVVSGCGGVRIVDSSLQDGAEDVPITAPIRFTFSRPMEPASTEARFHIRPEVEGRLLWEGQDLVFEPHTALAPDTGYTITLEEGAESEGGGALQEAHSWTFHTRTPGVLYLGRTQPGLDIRQLFLATPGGGEAVQLTDHPLGVWDFAVQPQGEEIAYSVLRGDGGSDLWRMGRDGDDPRLLLACPEAACLNPAWAPVPFEDAGGRWELAYERRELLAGAPNLDPNAGRIWLLDLEEGEERPLFDYDVPLHSPVWAPSGPRLAYVSPVLPGIEVHDLGTEDLQQFGNQWGAEPVWSPDSQRLVVPELMLAGESLVVHLIRLDLHDEAMVDISGDGVSEDAEHTHSDDETQEAAGTGVKDVAPAWSPGGGWIVFGRQYLDDERWTPGRQPWLTRPDASEAYPLLEEPMADLFAFAWRPDGAALVYLQTDLSEGYQPVPDVSVWVFDLVQREPVLVAGEGILPAWLP